MPSTRGRLNGDYPVIEMKREELADKLARQRHLPKAAARDQVDEVVHRILKALRRGKPVELPGLGKLVTRPANGRRNR